MVLCPNFQGEARFAPSADTHECSPPYLLKNKMSLKKFQVIYQPYEQPINETSKYIEIKYWKTFTNFDNPSRDGASNSANKNSSSYKAHSAAQAAKNVPGRSGEPFLLVLPKPLELFILGSRPLKATVIFLIVF